MEARRLNLVMKELPKPLALPGGEDMWRWPRVGRLLLLLLLLPLVVLLLLKEAVLGMPFGVMAENMWEDMPFGVREWNMCRFLFLSLAPVTPEEEGVVLAERQPESWPLPMAAREAEAEMLRLKKEKVGVRAPCGGVLPLDCMLLALLPVLSPILALSSAI
jgi:hypothetical protein